jgi:hypothetical protein
MVRSASRTSRLYPQECSWYSFSLGAESTPGPWDGRKETCHWKNPVTQPGIDPGTVRLVAQCLNHYAIPGPNQICSERVCEGVLIHWSFNDAFSNTYVLPWMVLWIMKWKTKTVLSDLQESHGNWCSSFELSTSQVEMTPGYETETWRVRTANLRVKYGYKIFSGLSRTAVTTEYRCESLDCTLTVWVSVYIEILFSVQLVCNHFKFSDSVILKYVLPYFNKIDIWYCFLGHWGPMKNPVLVSVDLLRFLQLSVAQLLILIPLLSFCSVVQSLVATSALCFLTYAKGGCGATEQWPERRKPRALSSPCMASVDQQEWISKLKFLGTLRRVEW